MFGISPDTEHGRTLLAAKASKTKRVQSKMNNNDVYSSPSEPSGPSNSIYESAAESFTGMGAAKSENINTLQRKQVDELSAKFKKALSEYSLAQKGLNEIASKYVNLQDSSKPIQGKFVKGNGPTVGYVTEQAQILPIASESVLTAMQGKLGCPSGITNVNGNITDPNAIGSMAGTIPNAIVSRQLQAAQPCSRTGVVLQAIGATNPETNSASWKGCVTPQITWQNEEIQASTRDDAIEQCRVSATDGGYPAFGIAYSEKKNAYTCSLAPQGTNVESISTNAFSIKTSTTLTQVSNSNYLTVFALLYNGQMATGKIFDDDKTIKKMYDIITLNNTSATSDCNQLTTPRPIVKSASYGVNCSGQSIPEQYRSTVGSSTYNVALGNWTDITNIAIAKDEMLAGYTIGLQDGNIDPAPGCQKAYAASYTCTGSDIKTISIEKEANGQTAVFDCLKEFIKCSLFRLTITDDGNLSFTSENGAVLWQSGEKGPALIYDSRAASKGKYGRNYLQSGEFLMKGEFIGSPSGTYWLTTTLDSSNNFSVSVQYAVIGCSGVTNLTQNPSSKGAYGDIGDGTSYGAYTMAEGTVTRNPRGMVYVDEQMKSRLVTSSKLGTTFTKISGYNTAFGQDLPGSPLLGLTVDQCNAKCSERDDCYGTVFNTANQCWFKGEKMFPTGSRNKDEKSDIYVRMSEPNYSSSCPTSVMASYANIIKGLPAGEPMSMSTQCGIGQSIGTQHDIVKAKEAILQDVTREVSNALKNLTAENQKIDNKLLGEMRKLQKEMSSYEDIIKKKSNIAANIPTTNAMEASSNIELSSDNIQYMMWAALAGIGVLAALKAAR